ncbi:MAG: hypothetical protein ACYTEZ_09290 [Planctomycetota bacterium]
MAIVLHTDGTDEKHYESSLRNRTLQKERFGTRALPHYVLLDPTGQKVYAWRGGVFDVEELIEFLRRVPRGAPKAERSG